MIGISIAAPRMPVWPTGLRAMALDSAASRALLTSSDCFAADFLASSRASKALLYCNLANLAEYVEMPADVSDTNTAAAARPMVQL